jgi:hypothetical protein
MGREVRHRRKKKARHYVLYCSINLQNYWAFGLCPSSVILEGANLYLSKGPSRVGVSHSPDDGNSSVSETLCSVVFRMPDNEQSPKI